MGKAENRATTQKPPNKCKFSIVIPVLNEQEHINPVLEHLKTRTGSETCEIIVVDGDPAAGTINAIQNGQVIKMTADTGRAIQMNAGAAQAHGEILVFLHADTKLPPNALEKIDRVLENPKYVAGAFNLEIDSDKLLLRYIAARARFRSRLNRIPYGDQVIFIRRQYFDKIGRFKEIPLMEDVDLMRRIKKDKKKIHILKDRVTTSPRRWERDGILYTTLRNQVLVALYYLGVSPESLAKCYWRHS
ncbi:MAG TPA: TIGR04283 family arsenosugar biosynthesis glycosyltransferase [Sedimentisphaerales bacterium]|nr:TIGR04283 family arsenosugar biosynthesis glycosyltransferase [Sedimentisphaerales bacterium]